MTRKSPIRPIKCETGSFRFKREEHLKGRSEIREVFGKGKRFYCEASDGRPGAKLFVLKNNLPYNRICFTTAKNFGNAIARNRAKRLGREAFRLIKGRLCGQTRCDLILLVYPESKMTLPLRIGQMETLFKRAGMLLPDSESCRVGSGKKNLWCVD